jgi:uncharacterized membrane protein (UPF0127 family)
MDTAYVIFRDGTRVDVEVARTDEERERGLMFRDVLAEQEGMLFPFDVPRRYGFWMKDVRVALDIIWLDTAGRIVCIEANAQPCAGEACPMYWPEKKASCVLEVAGGFVERHGVALGDTVKITLLLR